MPQITMVEDCNVIELPAKETQVLIYSHPDLNRLNSANHMFHNEDVRQL